MLQSTKKIQLNLKKVNFSNDKLNFLVTFKIKSLFGITTNPTIIKATANRANLHLLILKY